MMIEEAERAERVANVRNTSSLIVERQVNTMPDSEVIMKISDI
jgi:hypothetical protein